MNTAKSFAPSQSSCSAKDWLLNSGIQNMEGPDAGGFNSWFDLEKSEYPYVYSEITGYGITTLLFLADIFADDFMKRAEMAASWLEERAAHSSRGVRTRKYNHIMKETDKYSFDSDNIYAFDNGMVLYGVVNLYRISKKKKYLDFAVKIADFMIGNMRKPDGSFYAVYNPATGQKEDSDWKWSSQSGSYHSKLALGFIDLYEVTGDDKYKKAAVSLCENALKFQDVSGRFVTSRADNSTHFHPHSYSAEGLIYAGVFFDRQDFIRSAVKAVEWALNSQSEDGGLPKFFDGERFVPYSRTDILAQVLRLAVLMDGLGVLDKKYRANMGSLKKKLLGFQYTDPGMQKGGFYYGFDLKGKQPRHINSWCSMFAMQAVLMSERPAGELTNIDRMRCFV